MDADSRASRAQEQEDRIVIALAIVVGLLLIPFLLAWFSRDSSGRPTFPGLRSLLPSPAETAGTPVAPPLPQPAPVQPPPAAAPVADRAARDTRASGADLALAAAERSRLARLEFENTDLRSRLAAQSELLAGTVDRSERDGLAAEVETLKALVAKQEGETRRLQSRVTTLDTELSRNQTAAEAARTERERSAASEATLRKQLEEAAARAKAEEARFQSQLAETRATMSADAASLDTRMKKLGDEARSLQARLTAAEAERDAAKAELAKAGKPADAMAPGQPDPAAALRQELARTQTERKAAADLSARLEKELAALRGTSAAELKSAQDKIRDLETRLAAAPSVRTAPPLRDSDWTKFPAEAKRPTDLWPGAMPLFQALQISVNDGESVAERDRHLVESRLGELVGRYYFKDGHSTLDAASRSALDASAATLPKDSYLLVVGYASVRGKSVYNERLSSRRASHVATALRGELPSGKTQMVYFGETSQFDPVDQAKNRVVEVWRIPR